MMQKIKIIKTLIIIFSLSFPFSAHAKTVEEIIKGRKLRMMPTSSEIKKFIKSNKEYLDLLPIGVRL